MKLVYQFTGLSRHWIVQYLSVYIGLLVFNLILFPFCWIIIPAVIEVSLLCHFTELLFTGLSFFFTLLWFCEWFYLSGLSFHFWYLLSWINLIPGSVLICWIRKRFHSDITGLSFTDFHSTGLKILWIRFMYHIIVDHPAGLLFLRMFLVNLLKG